jgi:hypothetical protein
VLRPNFSGQHLSWYSLEDRYKDVLLVMRYKITNEKVATCFTDKKTD